MRGDGEPEVLVAAPCPAWDEPTPAIHRVETHGNKSHFVPKLVVLGFHPVARGFKKCFYGQRESVVGVDGREKK